MKNSEKSKLSTHELLKKYHGLPEYPAIARKASELAKEGGTKLSILENIGGIVESLGLAKLQMRDEDNAASLSVFPPANGKFDSKVIQQIRTALGIPPAVEGVLLPDGHLGYGLPIGGVIALRESISPAFIGYDISCMVSLTTYDITEEDFEENKNFFADALQKSVSFGVGSVGKNNIDDPVMHKPLWNNVPILKANKDMARAQLGSSGADNHFADIVKGETLQNVPGFELAGEAFIGLLTHSGSRGIGHKVAAYYMKKAEKETAKIAVGIPKGYGWLDIKSDLGSEYFKVMQLMGDYARANHAIIHDLFATFADNLIEITNINCRHNYAWVDVRDETNIIHRKGATPAHLDELGLIPGTSGTPSYVTTGLGNPISLFSSSHGAGRTTSRTLARATYKKEEFEDYMLEERILHQGVDADETYKAYKNIEDVMEVQDGVILERVAQLQPSIVIMGGKDIPF